MLFKRKPIIWKKNSKKDLVHWIVLIGLITRISFYISNHWYQLMLISGNSMMPSFHHMQMVVLDKHYKDYTYGDVIAFQCDNLDSILVKRIVACPKDTIVIREGTLYVNDVISDVFSQENIFEYVGILNKEICLKENAYFVIGDNVLESKDSRYEDVGQIGMEDILGRVLE